jgi:hypothetical protein
VKAFLGLNPWVQRHHGGSAAVLAQCRFRIA